MRQRRDTDGVPLGKCVRPRTKCDDPTRCYRCSLGVSRTVTPQQQRKLPLGTTIPETIPFLRMVILPLCVSSPEVPSCRQVRNPPRKGACTRRRACTRKPVMAVVFKYVSLFRQEIRLANAYRPPTPCMYSCSSEAGGRGELFRADVDAALLAARGVRHAAWQDQAAPIASAGWSKKAQ